MTGQRSRFNIAGTLVLLMIVVVWELSSLTDLIRLQYLPAPRDIVAALVELIGSGEMGAAFVHTLAVVLQASAIAVVIGVVAGLALGRSRIVQWTLGSTIDVLRSLPIIAFVPVVLLIFGLTRESEVFVAAYGAVWPMLVNVAGGMRHIDPRLGDVARTFGLSPIASVWKITLPAVLPYFLVGARLSAGIALVLVVVAEMIGNPAGLGYGLVKWQFALRPEAMWAYLVVVGLFGLVLNWVLIQGSRLAPASPGVRS